ncbi:hypothetical protein OVA03_02750 [Asticcacaulis sp. SL142]|uniref:hypothetical protein n=1 Tax=Asticcacaulis sp. SL142 TaxID=2995155 RepID=UPI00226CE5A0|nr:hypothetical protein [Asticcacaulis sp. SL142]WAC48861.1 hypothetical protein OVA03_02750 [Asticcacaulis sp. SL142]
MATKTRDDRLTDGDHNGKGIANDRYSKSASARPQIKTPNDPRPTHEERPHETSDAKSSASNNTQNPSGDPDGHSDAARKSKT